MGSHDVPFGTSVIAAHGHGLADLARERELALPVATCGDWTLADLVWHLAEVQDFWCHVVGNRPQGPATYDRPERPVDGALADLLHDSCTTLVDLLTGVDPAEHAWSWSDDHTVAFTLRRQSHEALVHHIDGLLAVGAPLPDIAPGLAADGIDEMVTVMLAGVPDWATFTPSDDTIGLVAGDTGHRWPLTFGTMTGTSPDTGTTYDLDALDVLEATAPLDATVSAASLTLDLWLWGRLPDDAVTVEGDHSAAVRLRRMVTESTQ